MLLATSATSSACATTCATLHGVLVCVTSCYLMLLLACYIYDSILLSLHIAVYSRSTLQIFLYFTWRHFYSKKPTHLWWVCPCVVTNSLSTCKWFESVCHFLLITAQYLIDMQFSFALHGWKKVQTKLHFHSTLTNHRVTNFHKNFHRSFLSFLQDYISERQIFSYDFNFSLFFAHGC